MRPLMAITLLASFALHPAVASARFATIEATITRIDEQACRVEMHITWEQTPPDLPERSCNEYLSYGCGGIALYVAGYPGTAYDISPPSEGPLVWISFGCSIGDDFAFSLDIPELQANLILRFTASYEWEYEFYRCDPPVECPNSCPNWVFAGSNLFGGGGDEGKLYAEVPRGIGEFAMFHEIPLAVSGQTWGQVKSLYKE